MAKVLNYSTLDGVQVGYIERRDPVKIEDALIEAARDGKNIDLLIAFARGEYNATTKEGYGSLIRQVLYTANLKDHDEVIKAVLGVNPESIGFYDKDLLGYDHVASIHAELSGESGADVVDESST